VCGGGCYRYRRGGVTTDTAGGAPYRYHRGGGLYRYRRGGSRIHRREGPPIDTAERECAFEWLTRRLHHGRLMIGGGRLLFAWNAAMTGEPAFRCLCADPGSGPSERGEHRRIEWDRRVCRGLSSTSGGSAVWPQCWLCAVCPVGRAGCCVCGGGTLRG